MDNSRESDRPVSVQVDEEYPIPPVVMEASTTSPSVNVSGIEDRFYENETNIVAVFDVDDDTVLQFQKNVAINWTFRSIGLLIVAFLYELIESHRLATIFMIIGILVTAFALNGWKDVRTAHRNLLGGGIHMAITTVSVRYDQPNPMISTEIALQNITFCSIERKRVRPFRGSEITLNLVHTHISGKLMPKVFLGLKDPKSFVNMVMLLKHEGTSSGSEHAIV